MPKVTKYPKLRKIIRKGAAGQVWVSYYYDMRGTGEKNIPLGHDYDLALAKWREIHEDRPRIVGTLEEGFKAWEEQALPLYENPDTRRNYGTNLRTLRKFDIHKATWEGVLFADLKGYLKKRSAKTQANREIALLSVIWHWSFSEGITSVVWPGTGMERSKWKNEEQAREFEVTDDLFDLVYAEGDQVLRDCMDLSTATGMRLTDCRLIALPMGDILKLKANKTGKKADFDIRLSQVLPELIKRRRGLSRAAHVMLLSTPKGKPVTKDMLRDRWDKARAAAAKKVNDRAMKVDGTERAELQALAERIASMFLRDMRKRASDLAEDDDAATNLLQHSSKALTRKHYRTVAPKLKPVR